MKSAEDLICVTDDPASIDEVQWNGLLERQHAPSPFMRHEYLVALHHTGCATAATGWAPRFITIVRAGRLVAACPVYLKSHSYGEYVFDWSWAQAYHRHGLAYYPKAVVAVPFTPVPGTRLLAIDDAARQSLLSALEAACTEWRVSSVHVLYPDEVELQLLQRQGWLQRQQVQFHWQRAPGSPTGDFDGFLDGLQREKRKKIRQERRRVAEQGIAFNIHEGEAITPGLWDFFHRCYLQTYQAHHSTPYLNRGFFEAMAGEMSHSWVMFVAARGGVPVACSLIAVDRTRGHAFGRYWGALEPVSCLHFEACYYQPLQWCLSQGFVRFEGGAQGDHKLSRGLLPVTTHSAHRVAHPGFARAIAEFVTQEAGHVAEYIDELHERSPFKPLR